LVKIDLHGLKYAEVEETLANLLITEYNLGNRDIEIITGNSEKMKILVKKICEDHNFRADIPWDGNTGILIVTNNEL